MFVVKQGENYTDLIGNQIENFGSETSVNIQIYKLR
jgi:hypothetical protein